MPVLTRSAPGLRQLQAARAVADCRSLTAAARLLNRTQPALSKSLADLEALLGVRLFDRYAHGMEPTPSGRVLVDRIREAEAQFQLAAREHLVFRRKPSRAANPVFTMQLSRKRLETFLTVYDVREVARAAEILGTSRAAVYDSLRVLENLLDMPLFESSASGLRSSAYADALAVRISLAFSLIRHGLEEIWSLDGAARGRLVIGTLPYSRTVLVPRAVHRVLLEHPALEIRTREGPYEVLELALRSGTVDLIVGATRKHEPGSPIRSEPLFEDELAVICRARHPLAAKKSAKLEDIMQFGWILPVREAPARQLFDRFLQTYGAGAPAQIVETGSLSVARGLLLESDRLALLSIQQVQLDLDACLLSTVPVHLEGTFRPIGITLRSHNTPSPAARAFVAALRGFQPDASMTATYARD
jgi:LysR family transcriptional regulator, regulator for genes of the gallate degradation pathway